MWLTVAALIGLAVVMLFMTRFVFHVTIVALAAGLILLARGGTESGFGAILLLAVLFVFARFYALTLEAQGHIALCDYCLDLERAFAKAAIELHGAEWRQWIRTYYNPLFEKHFRQVWGSTFRWWFHRIDRRVQAARFSLPERISEIREELED